MTPALRESRNAARCRWLSCLALFFSACCPSVAVDDAVGPVFRGGLDVHPSLIDAAKRWLASYGVSRGGGPAVTIALGNASESRQLISTREIDQLTSPDAFVIRSGWSTTFPSTFVFACAGKSPRATAFAFYELLQRLGFGFLHPLKPVLPESLPQPLPTINDTEEPRWHFRGTHYHTQHPLELTNLLNGYDSKGGHLERKRWASGLPEWEAFLDWMLAQKQTYVEWMLLADTDVPRPWTEPNSGSFELSDERQERLKMLVEAAHARGIEVGIDAPLTFQQQHALALLPSPTLRWESDSQEIKRRVQWLLDVGVDHLGTELGATEFSRGPSAEYSVRMLTYVKALLGSDRRLLVKNHCSTKQFADGFEDPRPSRSGVPLNFNYLSYYADPSIVAMPHTVQMYSLKDPAPTYGNTDFSDLRNWTAFLLQTGRPVVFYPETSYWVNYDVNVPLFLAPAYAMSRVEDANDIDRMNGPSPLLGQLNFESGWQWGYWLANSAQALTAWHRTPDVSTAFRRLLRFLGPVLQEQVADLLHDYAKAQKQLLIDGAHKSVPALGIDAGSVTGIAYIKGSEGASDLGGLMARYFGEGAPEPDRLRFVDLWTNHPLLSLGISTGSFTSIGTDTATVPLRQQWYHRHLHPLLANMNETFANLAARFAELPLATPAAQESLQDLVVSARLLSLRCSQVLALYDHAASCGSKADSPPAGKEDWCKGRLTAARVALNEALSIVTEREDHYGLFDRDTNRTSGWRTQAPNPTAYNFGYLWSVRNLFYWQRDQAIVEQRIYNPCYGTINDVVQLALRGGGNRFMHKLRNFMDKLLSNRLWKVPFAECIAVPEQEPVPLGIFAQSEHAKVGNVTRIHVPQSGVAGKDQVIHL